MKPLSRRGIYLLHNNLVLFHSGSSDELESAIEAIIQYMYKDVLKSYEEVKAEVNCDEQILSYHIFNEVDFVAKSLFPNSRFI